MRTVFYTSDHHENGPYTIECEACKTRDFMVLDLARARNGEGPATQGAKIACPKCGYKTKHIPKEKYAGFWPYGNWVTVKEPPVAQNMNEAIDKALDDVQEIFNRSPKRYEEQIENIITSILDLKEEVNAIA